MTAITKAELISRRLDNQQVGTPELMRPESLVSWLGCIQAQDFAAAKWAVGSRLKGQTDAGIQQAFNEGRILRTHILRPTWHFVTPEDIRWMLALTAPRIKTFCAGMHRQLELDDAVFRRSQAVLQTALANGQQLTRKELMPVFRQAKIRTDELRLAHLLMQAELDGMICSGAMNGKQFTYALMEDRAPQGKLLEPEEAVAELALRYFKSRGPATLADFAWWSGLTVTDGRKGVEACRSQFINETIDGQSYWLYAGTALSLQQSPPSGSPDHKSATAAGYKPAAASNKSTSVPSRNHPDQPGKKAPSTSKNPVIHVLPAFDEYTVAYKDRDLILSPKHAARSGNGIFKPIILQEGRIAGTWQRTIHKDHILIKTDIFQPVGRRLLKAAFAGYGDFMGKTIVCHFE